ncbi:trehalose-phosphatase [Labrys neptuniae]
MDEERSSRADPGNPPSAGEAVFAAALSEPDKWALFLDIDGTLIDLAETPLSIEVPGRLPADLAALSQRLGGALALVTGRDIALADSLFAPSRFPIAGLHGAERRQASGALETLIVPASFEQLKREIATEAEPWAGVLVEDKGAALALHYRLAPDRKGDVEALMQRAAEAVRPDWTLQQGKMVVELRPARASKGRALTSFLEEAPFRGRLPLAIGDDLTDEAMFESANGLGGQSIRIGSPGTQTLARALISSPAALRALIARPAA